MKNMNSVQGMTALPAHVGQANTHGHVKMARRVSAYAILAMLGGYIIQLVNPVAEISVQEMNLLNVIFVLTLLLVIPIIALNVYFVARHRASNTTTRNSPRYSHSIRKELLAWAFPIVVVAVVTFVGWLSIH